MLKVSLPHKLCVLNLKAEHDDDHNCLIILPTEEGHQEIVFRMEPCHEPVLIALIDTLRNFSTWPDDRYLTGNLKRLQLTHKVM